MNRDQPAPWPANELETALDKARIHDDRAYALRAFSRNVICMAANLPGPPPGRVWFKKLSSEERPLPVAEGRDGRPYVLVFTSSFTLFRHYQSAEQVWTQSPAGQLAEQLAGQDAPWMVNVAGPYPLVLEPADVAVIASIYRGRPVMESFGGGGAATEILLARPGPEAAGLAAVIDPVLRATAAERVVAAVAHYDEPRSPQWLRLGVEWPDGSQEATIPVMRDLVSALERASSQPVEVVRLTSRAGDRRFAEHGLEIWSRPPAGG